MIIKEKNNNNIPTIGAGNGTPMRFAHSPINKKTINIAKARKYTSVVKNKDFIASQVKIKPNDTPNQPFRQPESQFDRQKKFATRQILLDGAADGARTRDPRRDRPVL